MSTVIAIVTAFDPFDGHRANSSEVVVSQLESPDSITLIRAVLPTSVRRAPMVLAGLMKQFQPSLVLCCGQAASRPVPALRFEQRAHNYVSLPGPDNDGVCHPGGAISAMAPQFYDASLSYESALRDLSARGVPAVRSQYAGSHVCNLVFFHACILSQSTGARCGFVHIPPLTSSTSHEHLDVWRAALARTLDSNAC